MPIDMLTSTYKRFLMARSSSFTVQKGGKGKGKPSKFKARWLPQEAPRATEEVDFDLVMLPHPTLVNREDETYVLTGPSNLNVRVTKENWDTLRFNTKTFNPEYFPASYLRMTSSDGVGEGWGYEHRKFSSFHDQRNSGRLSVAGTSTPSETTEAAGFGSDTSPRTESGDNDELSGAGPN
jgi:hypothetical protein